MPLPLPQRIRARTGVLMILLALTGACGDDTGPAMPPATPLIPIGPVTLTGQPAAGAELRVQGEGLRGAADASLRVVATAGTGAMADLSVRRVDETTLAVIVPDTLFGPQRLTLVIGSSTADLGAVDVAGFDAGFAIAPAAYRDLVPYLHDGRPRVVGTAPGGQPTLYALDVRTATPFGPRLGMDYPSPGVSYREGVFLLPRGVGDTVEAWAPEPTPQRVTEHPGLDWNPFVRGMMQLGPDRWLRTSSQRYRGMARADSTQSYGTMYDVGGSSYGLVPVSPRGDRATILGAMPDGVPVFALPGGDIAYRVTKMWYAFGAAFSPDGELLAIGGAGYDQTGAEVRNLVVVRAGSGDILHETKLDGGIHGVAFDPTRPLLYVATTVNGRPRIYVLARRSWQVLARLSAPLTLTSCGVSLYEQSCFGVLVASREHALYLTHRGTPGALGVWRYRLPTTPFVGE